MTISIYQTKLNKEKKQKAFKLYKQGLTLREVGKLVGKSRTWVMNATKELTGLDR